VGAVGWRKHLEFVYYFLMKKEWDTFMKNLNERIKNKQDAINEKLDKMN
jgi:hypothetical protein